MRGYDLANIPHLHILFIYSPSRNLLPKTSKKKKKNIAEFGSEADPRRRRRRRPPSFSSVSHLMSRSFFVKCALVHSLDLILY